MEHPDKKVLDLDYSLCPNMFKIILKILLWTAENIGQVKPPRPPGRGFPERKTDIFV